MKVVVALEQRFVQLPDGTTWTDSGIHRDFWNRYLDIFTHISIVARVNHQETIGENWHRADGGRITFVPVPHYIGPLAYLKRRSQVIKSINESAQTLDAVILRSPGQVSDILGSLLVKRGQPFGVEVVGDPFDVFARGAIHHPLRPFLQRLYVRRLQTLVSKASAVAYVTQNALQRRYPAASSAFQTNYSSVALPESAFVNSPKQAPAPDSPIKLVFVGSLAQLYKAPDILLHATRSLISNGMNLQVTIIGDGKFRTSLENQANALGIAPNVHFTGNVPSGENVTAELDNSNLFVLPSRTEGLPRAMIEAMARGLPCIGTNVGGIPELLPAPDMVQPGDVDALSAKILEVTSDPERMKRMSTRNLIVARDYHQDILQSRRNCFYEVIRSQTEDWLSRS